MVQDAQGVAEAVGATLDVLAARFGATGQVLWESLVRYEAVQATVAVWIIGVVTGLAFLLFLVSLGFAVFSDRDDDAVIGLFAGSAIALIVMAVVCLAAGPSLIATLMSPEAAALKALVP